MIPYHKQLHLKGFGALISVLVTGAMVTAIALSVVVIAISEGQLALSGEYSERILQRVEGCAEDVLIRLNATNTISAGVRMVPEGSCTVSVLSHVGDTWTFTVIGSGTGVTKRIRVTAQRTSGVSVSEWIEY